MANEKISYMLFPTQMDSDEGIKVRGAQFLPRVGEFYDLDHPLFGGKYRVTDVCNGANPSTETCRAPSTSDIEFFAMLPHVTIERIE